MKLIKLSVAVVILPCLFVSCENKSEESISKMDLVAINQEQKSPEHPNGVSPQSTESDKEYKQSGNGAETIYQKDKKQIPKSNPQAKPDWDKKIIKTASINAEVKDYNNYYASLREKVKNIGGYVAQEEQTQSEYKIENSLTVKVPVDQFDEALTLLTNGTVMINERKITSQDVTTEVVDARSRMEAKKQVRERYIDLLKQAKNMQEILNVQSEINGVQEEIESATGRISYLSHASVFSTINFTFFQVLDVAAKEKQGPGSWTKIGKSFKIGWAWAFDFIIALISIWPLLLLFSVAFILIRKYTRTKVKPV